MREVKDKNWPAWYYGPKGASGTFEREEDVPKGWTDHPALQSDFQADRPAVNPGNAVLPNPSINPGDVRRDQRSVNVGDEGTGDVDADGWPWDDSLHAATKTKTQAGLWRMKVGVTRPDPKPGFPKPAKPLDL